MGKKLKETLTQLAAKSDMTLEEYVIALLRDAVEEKPRFKQ